MTAFTSASANKYLKSLEDEKEFLLAAERSVCVYTRTADEEALPPSYDYAATRAKIRAIDAKVRTIRHALHMFNASELLPDSGISIDEALILLAQLNNEKALLATMRSRQPVTRVNDRYMRSGDMIEYTYANYDVEAAGADYADVLERIAALQLELDLVNQTHSFEVDLGE
jgi:hypothetical protein